MPIKKVIFSASLQEFRPIIWYGEPVFFKYSQLKNIIAEKLGSEYAGFLSEPLIPQDVIEGKGKANWLSEFITTGVSFTKLPASQQEIVRIKLTEIINKIKRFASELKTAEDINQRQLGELLILAVEVPALDYVFVEDNKITLVLWGFTSEEAKKANFQISKVLEAPIEPKMPEVQNIQPIVIKEEKTSIEKQIDNSREIKTAEVQNNSTPPVIPPTTPITSEQKNKKGVPAWLWFILGALLMFLLLFLLWWFFLRQPSFLPPHANILPPIDTTKLGTDPNDPTKRKIFTDRFNVALKKNANGEKFAEALHIKFKENLKIAYYDTVINLFQIETPQGEWKQWMDSVKKMPDARLVFAESLFQRSFNPTDPGFSDTKKNWYFELIGAYKAWDITKGSPDVVVAIIDNGFDLTHPEFKDKIVKPWNVFSHSPNVQSVKIQGGEHGTHVAATSIGLANNGQGLAGIAPNCKFMPIQVADQNGNMSSLAVVAGLLYAINQGANVVNMSLGMMFPPQVKALPESQQKELIKSLYPDESVFWNELYSFGTENQMIIVQAAGNDNLLAGIDPAARSQNTIVVSAVAPGIEKAEFSNWGEMSLLSAPGVEIYSAIPGNKYEFLQGTSMASPIVAGAAALMRSKYPKLSAKKIIDILVKTAKSIQSENYIGPLLQIDKALLADTSDTDNTMIIPKNPKDLTFAEGRWKSNNDLVSTIDKKRIQLFFDIKKSGDGQLTLIEENGTQCMANIKISFKDGKLQMEQLENAKCGNNKFYYPYLFECIQGDNNEADCKAKQKNSNADVIQFKLYKQL